MKECSVTIYTQVYNTAKYLEQCILSVLNQTYNNFRYILVDNGSTDGSGEIIEKFSEQDSRIHRICYKENQSGIYHKLICQNGCGDYVTLIDSDDWWESNYLERLIGFLETNHLDMAVTGAVQYVQEQNLHRVMRKLETPTILTQRQFAQYYPQLWTFPSTTWGSIMRTEIFQKMKAEYILDKRYPYGADTMAMLEYIKLCSRIGIDNSALYHYRIHPKSVSYQYNPRRFDANIVYYEQIKDFLELHHTFDPSKQEWLKRVHLSSMLATLQLLRDAKVPEDKKAEECARIAAHSLTATALTADCAERTQWFDLMREIVFHALASGTVSDPESLYTALKLLLPHSCGAVLSGNLGLFAKEKALREALRADDREQLIKLLMELICQKRYTKQYDLGQILCGLIPDGQPLQGIADTRFFREYALACMLMLQEDYSSALDQMTGLLLEGKKLYDGERFLNVYLSLAALEDHAPAFVFGKLQLARLLLRQNCRDECRTAVDELTGMGLDNDELAALRQELEDKP